MYFVKFQGISENYPLTYTYLKQYLMEPIWKILNKRASKILSFLHRKQNSGKKLVIFECRLAHLAKCIIA
jgi:hypothetical protein